MTTQRGAKMAVGFHGAVHASPAKPCLEGADGGLPSIAATPRRALLKLHRFPRGHERTPLGDGKECRPVGRVADPFCAAHQLRIGGREKSVSAGIAGFLQHLGANELYHIRCVAAVQQSVTSQVRQHARFGPTPPRHRLLSARRERGRKPRRSVVCAGFGAQVHMPRGTKTSRRLYRRVRAPRCRAKRARRDCFSGSLAATAMSSAARACISAVSSSSFRHATWARFNSA